MTHFSKLCVASLAVLTVSVFSTTSNADWYQRINRQSVLLQGQAKELANQTKHYKGASNYTQLVSETREIADLARHIQDVASKRGRLTFIENDLAELDRRYERLERRLEASKRYMTSARGGIGQGQLRYVNSLMRSIETSIDAMQAEAAKMRAAYEIQRQRQLDSLRQQYYYNQPVIYQTQFVPTYVPTYSPTVITTYPGPGTIYRTTRVYPRRGGVIYNSRTGRGRVRVGGIRIGF